MSGFGSALAMIEAAELAALTAKAAAAPHSEAATIYAAVALDCLKNARRVLEFDLAVAARTIIRQKDAA